MDLGLFRRDVSKQFFKFVLIGLECAVVNFLVFLVFLNYLSLNYLISSGSGFVSGTFFGFFFNRKYTFKSNQKTTKSIFPYFLVYTFSLFFGLLILKFLVDSLLLSVLLSNFMILFATTMTNFFGIKIFVFKNQKW